MSWNGGLRSLRVCARMLNSTMSLHNSRTPLIMFPVRRTPTGEPLFALSLDKYQSTRSAPPPTTPTPTLPTTPASYGRKPLSEEEMDAINLGTSFR